MFLLYIIFFYLFLLIFQYRKEYYVSSVDRDIKLMLCIKFNNSCTKYDAIKIREICLLKLKGINYFPKEALANDIFNICTYMFKKETNHFFKLYGNTINTYNSLYGIENIQIIKDKSKLLELLNTQ